MKPNKPELSSKWWSAVCPDGVDGKKLLAKAMAQVEGKLEDAEKKPDDAKTLDACLAALKALPKAASKVVKECDKKNDKEVIAGLKQLDKLCSAEADRIGKAKKEGAAGGDGDDDEDEGKLFEKDYVHKLIKLVKSSGKEINFAFGLDMNDPEACDLLLHRKKKGEMLWKALKKTKKFPNRLMCYGFAVRDAEDSQALCFKLEPGSNVPPSRIFRTVKKLFQKDKKMRFKKLTVIGANGTPLSDDEPEVAPEAVGAGADGAGGGGGGPEAAERREQARAGLQDIEDGLRRMAAELNINL